MHLPHGYKTGNRKMDKLILESLEKRPVKLANDLEELLGLTPENKYNVAAKEDRTYSDGTLFASKKEMERWDYLLKLQQAGEISDLQQQIPFVIFESFYTAQYGKVNEIVYVSDFVYTNISYRKGLEGKSIVEDSKSGPTRTKEYKIKRKLFLYKYPDYYFFEV
jgi:hypothetical protein